MSFPSRRAQLSSSEFSGFSAPQLPGQQITPPHSPTSRNPRCTASCEASLNAGRDITSAASALGVSIATTVTDPTVYAAIAWVMTLGIIPGLVLVPLCMKKIQRGLVRLKSKDEKWGDIFMSALFMGMISACLGMIFGNIGQGIQGWIPVFVMLISAGLMCLCGLLVKKWAWLRDFALPICMLASMALSIPLTFALV